MTKRYGLLIQEIMYKGKGGRIFKPIYSNDLKLLKNLKYRINTEDELESKFCVRNISYIQMDIYDYEKMCYVH